MVDSALCPKRWEQCSYSLFSVLYRSPFAQYGCGCLWRGTFTKRGTRSCFSRTKAKYRQRVCWKKNKTVSIQFNFWIFRLKGKSVLVKLYVTKKIIFKMF